MTRRARDVLLDILRDEGITHVFGNPGSTEMPLVDAPIWLISWACRRRRRARWRTDGRWPPARVGLVNLHAIGGLGNMPAALGAWLAGPGPVASFVGDGGAMYSPQALWSAAHYRAKVVFFVFNNSRYGVLQNVAKSLGYSNAVAGRSVGMKIVQPAIDFQALAASMGVTSARADERESLAAAVADALSREGPTLIEIAIR